MPEGVAWFDPRTRLWWRTGLDQPVWLAGTEAPRVLPSLGAGPVVVHLGAPIVLIANTRVALRVRWPVLWEVRVGAVVVDRFRPAMRTTLLGPLGEGRLLDSAVAHALPDDEPPPDGWCALHLVAHHGGSSAATVRRVAFGEDGLTLARTPRGLRAGEVDVRVLDGDHAVSSCGPLPLAADGEVLRPADARAARADAGGLRWWLDGTRRSMGFSL